MPTQEQNEGAMPERIMTPEELQSLKEAVAATVCRADPEWTALDIGAEAYRAHKAVEKAQDLLYLHSSALIQAAEEVASLKAENEKLRAFAEHCLSYDLADIRSRASEALATLPQEGK